jgi:hypothetical protein
MSQILFGVVGINLYHFLVLVHPQLHQQYPLHRVKQLTDFLMYDFSFYRSNTFFASHTLLVFLLPGTAIYY